MRIEASSPEMEQRLTQSMNRILNNCSPELRTQIESFPLLLTDDLRAESIYSDQYGIFRRAYELGFGAMKGRVGFEGNLYHLVVINFTRINRLHLDDNEVDGVISHELGHVFNDVPVREMPSIMNNNTMQEIDAAKEQLKLDKELFADFFAKRTQTEVGLISSMNKYLDSSECQNREMFVQRLSELNSENEYNGPCAFPKFSTQLLPCSKLLSGSSALFRFKPKALQFGWQAWFLSAFRWPCFVRLNAVDCRTCP